MTMPQTHLIFASASATATLILTSTTATVSGSLAATKVVSNTIETVGIMDQLAVKSNSIIFGNGLTHTILGDAGSEFYSLPVFHEAIQVRSGIESGFFLGIATRQFHSNIYV